MNDIALPEAASRAIALPETVERAKSYAREARPKANRVRALESQKRPRFWAPGFRFAELSAPCYDVGPMEQSEPEGVDALEERRDALAKTLDAAPIDDEPLDENERAALGKRTLLAL